MRIGSANGKTFLLQQNPVTRPQLHPPVPLALWTNAVTTVGAVAHGRIGSNVEINHLPQLVAAIPAMLNQRIACGSDARVKEKRARMNRKPRPITLPLTADASCNAGG